MTVYSRDDPWAALKTGIRCTLNDNLFNHQIVFASAELRDAAMGTINSYFNVHSIGGFQTPEEQHFRNFSYYTIKLERMPAELEAIVGRPERQLFRAITRAHDRAKMETARDTGKAR